MTWREIRKFGPEYCDLPTMLWNVSVFLRALTLNIDNKYTKAIPIYNYIITILMAMCYFYVYLISMIWFVFVRCPQTGALIAAIVVLSLGISTEIGIIKLVCMFLYIDKIKKITHEYLQFDAQVTPGTRYSDNLLKALKIVKKRAIFYWLVLFGNGVIYLLKPILSSGKHLTEDYQVIYGLEPMFESPNFEIAWVLIAASVIIITYISANVTAYLIVVTGYAESQMIALSKEIIYIWPDAQENYKAQIIKHKLENDLNNLKDESYLLNDYVTERLKYIIKNHSIIRNLLHQVEEVFSRAIALGFVLLLIGVIVELLAGLENTYLQLPFAFMQVGLDCYIGQKVIDAGIVFEQAVYDSKWENFNKRNMKLILIMLQISQNTVTLSAGGITKLNFTCLMSAMRATYSAYTTLLTIMN